MASGTIAGITSNPRIDSKIEWTAIPNVAENYSTLSLFLYFRRNNTGYTTEGTGTFTLKAGGQSSTSEEVHLKIQESWILAYSATFRVDHNDDGTMELTVSAEGSLPPSSLESVSCSKKIVLDTIARASKITSISNGVNIGEFLQLTWTPLDTTHSFRVVFTLGGWSDSFDVPRITGILLGKVAYEAAEQLPDSRTGNLTVTLYTIDKDGNTIGYDSKVVSVFIVGDENFLPTVESTFLPYNEGIPESFADLYVQGFSKVQAAAEINTKYGSSVKTINLAVDKERYTDSLVSGVLYSSGQKQLKVQALDSRNLLGESDAETIEVLAYAPPIVSVADGQTEIVCDRCDSDGNLSETGTSLRIIAKRNYSQLVSNGTQRNFCRLQYRYGVRFSSEMTEWTTILDSASDTDEVDIVIQSAVSDLLSAYTVQIRAIDDIGQENVFEATVASDEIFSHEISNGMAYGERAEANTFSVAESWKSKLKGPVYVGGKLVVDHIVEIGDNYRVWKSGRAEVWGSQDLELTSTPFMNESLWETQTFTLALPISIEEAVCVMNPSASGMWAENISIAGNQMSFAFLSNPAILYGQQFTVGYYITGKKI